MVRQGDESPVRLVHSAFGNPFANSLLLSLAQRQVRDRRWHHLLGVGREKPLANETQIRVGRHNSVSLVLALRVSILGAIQTKLRLAAPGIGSVAFETAVREQGSDVAIKIDLCPDSFGFRRPGGTDSNQ